jgi:tetratricopeptide (TPR) repeat protein
MGKKDEFASVKAGLVMLKKELEEKTGKTGSSSKKKKTNQEELLKKIKSKKKQREDLGVDILELNRSSKYEPGIDVMQVLEMAKEKLWTDNKNIRLINTAMLAYSIIGDYKKAEFEYKKGSHIDSENKDLNYNMAELYLKQGKLSEAFEKIAQCLKGEKDYEALYLMSLILFLQGKKEKTSEILANTLKNDMEFERVHLNFAFLSFIRSNIDKAKEILSNLLLKYPERIYYRVALSFIKIYMGDFEGYKEDVGLMTHLIKDPNTEEMQYIYFSRAYYFIKKGDLDKAEKEFSNIRNESKENIVNILLKTNFEILKNKDYSSYEYIKECAVKHRNFLPFMILAFKMAYIQKKGEDFNKFLSVLLKINKNQKISLKLGDEKKEVKISELIKKISEYNKTGVKVEMDMDIEPFEEMCIYILYSAYGICSNNYGK